MNVAVYCSAKDCIPEEYLELGDELGCYLAQHSHRLVYGGATGGLMSRTSQAAKKAAGYVIGVVPERIIKSGRLADNCDEQYLVQNMNERKQRMKELADCFICLPGSYGTLDEMYDVIASGTVGEHHKPTIILNYQGFYNGLIAEAQRMKELQFLPKEESYKPVYVTSLEEVYQELETINEKLKNKQ